jgi:hypothetical protein
VATDADAWHDLGRQDEDGLPTPEVDAGFVELEPVDYADERGTHRTRRARLFYSLFPSRDDAKERPVFVFFNGGPGASTTGLLHAFGTGPTTVNDVSLGGEVVSNGDSFTELGSLLYIDSRNAGFSYNVAEDPTWEGERLEGVSAESFNEWVDAADFVRVLLRVLYRHAALRNNRVILVGESYGAYRATFMLEYLFAPQRLDFDAEPNPLLPYRDPALAAELRAHYAAVFPGVSFTAVEAAIAGHQFGARVFIQPAYGLARAIPAYPEQAYLTDCTAGAPMARAALLRDEPCPLSPASYDENHLAKPRGWFRAMKSAGVDSMMTPSGFEQRFGLHPSEVLGLTGEDRRGAFRFGELPVVIEAPPEPTDVPADILEELADDQTAVRESEAWQQALGALEAWDRHFLPSIPHGFRTEQERLVTSLHLFLKQAPWVRTLVTDAAFDVSFPSRDVVGSVEDLRSSGALDVTARYSEAIEEGEERPGWLELGYGPDLAVPEERRHVRIRMPRYDLSSHVVTMTEGSELMQDVRDFLFSPPDAASSTD